MNYKVSVVVEKDEHGYYAYSPELDGCQTQGDTFDEVLSNIKEAVELYLETLPKTKIKKLLSKDIFNTSVEVKVGLALAPDRQAKGACPIFHGIPD